MQYNKGCHIRQTASVRKPGPDWKLQFSTPVIEIKLYKKDLQKHRSCILLVQGIILYRVSRILLKKLYIEYH